MATIQPSTYRIIHRILQPRVLVGELPFAGDVVLHFVCCTRLCLQEAGELRHSSTISFEPVTELFLLLQLVNQPPITITQDHFKTLRYFSLLPLHTLTPSMTAKTTVILDRSATWTNDLYQPVFLIVAFGVTIFEPLHSCRTESCTTLGQVCHPT